jgi:hypothetical protein
MRFSGVCPHPGGWRFRAVYNPCMKSALAAVFIAIFSDPIGSAQQSSAPDRSDRVAIPAVHLLYNSPNGTVFDRSCGGWLKTKVSTESIREAARRAPEFQALWDREGPTYLSATFAEIGLPFPYKEMQAALTVCPGIPSMSLPLMVSVTRFLPSSSTRDPDSRFVEIVYHELMHTYTREVNAISALRKKYADEELVVLAHLHVMALEKFVLLKLGRAEELKRVGDDYQTRFGGPYKRAWVIVNEIEGHEAFVKELKQVARPHH